MPGSKRGFAVGLTAIAVAGFALRIAFVVFSRVQHLPLGLNDSGFYSTGANLLAQGRGFIDPFALPHTRQAAGHPPLYILWLAIPSLVWTGQHATPTVHMVWSCVLGTGTIVICGLAGREMASRRVGLIAAGLAAIYPNIWVHDGMLFSETAAIFTTAGIILFAYRFLHRPSTWRAIWLGLWCGLAALARPELVLALPLVLAPLVLFRRAAPWKQRIIWLVGGAVATAVLITPWIGYNLDRFERPVYMSDNLGRTLAAANCHDTFHGKDLGFKSYPCAAVAAKHAKDTHPGWDHLDESEQDFLIRQPATKYLKAHASRVPVVLAARWARIAELYKPFDEVRLNTYLADQPTWLGDLLVYSYYVMIVVAIAGAVVMRKRKVPIWPLVAIPVIVLISVAVTFAQTRYRAPAEVAFVMAAAFAVDALIARFRHESDHEAPPEAPVPETVAAA